MVRLRRTALCANPRMHTFAQPADGRWIKIKIKIKSQSTAT